MKIAVRLDDITPDMDWERFLKFKALLDKYQVKPLIGVVPDNKDDNLKGSQQGAPADFWAYIKELQEQGWCVAMHGYRHIYATDKGGIFPLNNFSEFAGIPYEKQLKMLAEGKRILAEKEIDTDIFMAPAHSYDDNTLKALKTVGFVKMTDGFGSRPYIWKNILFYPISFKMSQTLKKKQGYSTMIVHTGTVSEEELSQYEKRFQLKEIEWISFEEYMNVPAKEKNMIGRYTEYLMAKGKYLLGKLR